MPKFSFDGWQQDFRHALRSAGRARGLTFGVIATLAVGIGATAAAFDALDRAILNPLPFNAADRLAFLAIRDNRPGSWKSPDPSLLNIWRAQSTFVEQMEVMRLGSTVLHSAEGASRMTALGISGGFTAMLGVQPILGRSLLPADAEPSAAPVVMLSEQTWRRHFGADPSIVGRTLPLGPVPHPTLVVGIWPANARLSLQDAPDFINTLPLGSEYRFGAVVTIVVRLREGVSHEAVESELTAIGRSANRIKNDEKADVTSPAEQDLGERYIRGVWLAFAGALALFAVAVVNAGHLLLGRATNRQHELGVRLALGASGINLFRLFCLEALVHAAAASVLGAIIATGLEKLVARVDARLFAPLMGAGLPGRTFWFIVLAASAATLVCGLAPLIRVSSRDIRQTVEQAGGRSTRRESTAMHVLMIAQASLAVLLVCGAVLTGRSVANLWQVETGLAIEGLASISVPAPASRFPTQKAREAYLERVRETLAALPNVRGVTTSGMPLLSTSIQRGQLYLEGEPKPPADSGAVSALASVPINYFEVTGMRLIDGRGFRAGDPTTIAVVNEAFAASKGGKVLGKRVYTPQGQTPFEIVGVVANVKVFGVANEQTRFGIYFPERDSSYDFARFFVRTSGDPRDVVREARARIAAIDPTVPMFPPETGKEVVSRQTAQHRLIAILLTGLAIMALALALSGVYSASAMNVARRRREIGIRGALGAGRKAILVGVMGATARPVTAGALLGVIAGFFVLPSVRILLYQVSPHDPVLTAIGVLLVVIVAAVAAFVPAWRASRIDPASVLRQ